MKLESRDQVNRRLAQLGQQASAAGLRVDEIVPGRAAPGSVYATVPIYLSGTGSYQTCTRFLHQLHQRFSDTGVAGFHLSVKPNTRSGRARFSFELRWFTLPQQVASAQ